jgi:hypothetical protein
MVAFPVVAAGGQFAPCPNIPCSGDISCVIGLKPNPGGGPLELEKAIGAILPSTPLPARTLPWSPIELLLSVRSLGGPLAPRWPPSPPSVICHDSSEWVSLTPSSRWFSAPLRLRRSPLVKPKALFIVSNDMPKNDFLRHVPGGLCMFAWATPWLYPVFFPFRNDCWPP